MFQSPSVSIESMSKEEKYKEVLLQIPALVNSEPNSVANLANITALLKDYFHWWWVGFYLVEGEQLVLGPFQGPVACTRIWRGKGVCGTAWERNETIRVDDVNKFPGHIACSAASQSEIVVPLRHENEVIGVLDVDSEHLGHFDETDAKYLGEIASISASLFSSKRF